jgi:hypothetical protein
VRMIMDFTRIEVYIKENQPEGDFEQNVLSRNMRRRGYSPRYCQYTLLAERHFDDAFVPA